MKILLASRNKNKIKELETLLCQNSSKEITVVSLDDIGFYDEIEETGSTFEENALIKSLVGSMLGYITVSDDSGLEVDYLNGAPGVYSARYSGEDADDAKNNAKLLRELDGVPEEKRTARFVSCVVCTFPDGRDPIKVFGSCEGVITTKEHGSGGFGYDPLFYCPEFSKTFGELSPEEKNSISHRGRAMRAFAEEFKKIAR